jgi:DNA processing protein
VTDRFPPAIDDEARAHALALTSLPGCHHTRLGKLLAAAGGDPVRAWRELVGPPTLDLDLGSRLGVDAARLLERWRGLASATDVVAPYRRAQEAGIDLWISGEAGYPPALVDDPDPPPVLFHAGRGEARLGVRGGAGRGPAVAIVGTRRCTAYGLDVARDLGRGLADAGVTVVSGLALGIDGAAHRGALEALGAAPVGVVGNGLDAPYPPQHRRLWEAVAAQGVLLGEAPAGAAPAAWRFPARNRIIAALADVVVVVESHARGGSLHTVEEAAARDVEVMAVPGSVRSPASAGTNKLLQEGCAPVLEPDDVLLALGLTPGSRRRQAPPEPPPGDAGAVLDAIDGVPLTFEHLALRSGLPLDRLGLAVETLVDAGWVTVSAGWYERADPRVPQGRPR